MTQRPGKKKKKQGKKLMVGLIAALLAVVVGIGIFLLIYSRDDGLIFNNVYAMDVNLGGMTQQEAAQAIEQRAKELYAQNLTIQLQDRTLVLTQQETGAKVDAQAVAQAAFDHGREGNMFQRAKERSAAELTSYTLDMGTFVSMDEDYVRQAVTQLGQQIDTPLRQPVITIEGQQPDVTQYILKGGEDEDTQGLTVIDGDEPYYVEGGQTLTIQTGVPGRELDTQTLLERVMKAYAMGDFNTIETTYSVTEPNPLNVQELYARYCIAPVEAVLNEETYEVTRETLGYGFRQEDLQLLLDTTTEGGTVTMEFQILVPEQTKASIEATLFQDVLVSIKTKHTWNNKRTTNLILACEAIDGYILKPDATFSFNEVVGERTAKKGYQEATVYSGYKSVQELGGGVCQVASTLYYGALLADFEIVERAVHTFTVDYVPRGMDATIYWGHLDFKFKNNTGYPVKIVTSVHDGYVYLEYLGTETKDYYIKMEWDETDRDEAEVVEVEFTEKVQKEYPDNKVGDTIVSAYNGYKGYSYKCKYNKETDELISREKEAYSSYARRDKQVLVAPKTEPTEPKPTDPKPTEPKPTEPAPTEPKPTEAPTDPPPADTGTSSGDE